MEFQGKNYHELGLNWLIDLYQDKQKWWTFVDAVMNIGVPKIWGNFLTKKLSASQEWLCSM
jgi:hypothetical protein